MTLEQGKLRFLYGDELGTTGPGEWYPLCLLLQQRLADEREHQVIKDCHVCHGSGFFQDSTEGGITVRCDCWQNRVNREREARQKAEAERDALKAELTAKLETITKLQSELQVEYNFREASLDDRNKMVAEIDTQLQQLKAELAEARSEMKMNLSKEWLTRRAHLDDKAEVSAGTFNLAKESQTTPETERCPACGKPHAKPAAKYECRACGKVAFDCCIAGNGVCFERE